MADDHDVLNALYRQSFQAFLAKCFEIVEPGKEFKPNWHIEAIGWALVELMRGEETDLIINMPPRYLKSLATSVAFVCWMLGRDPRLRIICMSYSEDLALMFSRNCRRIMESSWYRKLFPHTRLSRSTELELETTKGGGRLATSVGGTLTGKGGDILIFDDILKADDGNSESKREAVNQWYRTTAYSRGNSKNAKRIIIMQRLHPRDLTGMLIEDGVANILSFPAIATAPERIPIGLDQFHDRQEGDVLHPAIADRPELEKTRRRVGPAIFEAQYQQDPKFAGGTIFRVERFQYFDTIPQRQYGDRLVLSWDTALKQAEPNSWSVCTVWLAREDWCYLLAVERDRFEFHKLKKRAIDLVLEWKPTDVLIEDAVSGTPLLQELRKWRADACWPGNLEPIHPKGSKVTRAETQEAKIAEGRVHLKPGAPYLDPLLEEVAAFPNGEHDDQIDSMVQFLAWWDNPRPLPARWEPNRPPARRITRDMGPAPKIISDGRGGWVAKWYQLKR